VKVTVVWATPHVQDSVELELAHGATIADAVARSGLLIHYHLDPATVAYAVHGRRKPADAPLADGDRVELTRPLVADPGTARARRAREAPLGTGTQRGKRPRPG
jgi:hypothetical protein